MVLIATLLAPFASASSSAPIVYRGDQWFGGSGVNVCTNTNGGGSKDYCGSERYIGGVAGARWQCVEMVQRFYKKMGWHSGVFSGVWLAHDIYDRAAQNGFTRQANGSITSIQPGDMIIHHKNERFTGGAGHVAVVDRISGNIIYAVEQNSGSPTAAYTLSGKTLHRQSMEMIRGIVKPPVDSSNRSSGAATSLSYVTAPDGRAQLFSGATDGRVHLTSWSGTNTAARTTSAISSLPAAVTALSSVARTGQQPEVYVGTEAGALYRISGSGASRTTARIATIGSPIRSLAATMDPSGNRHLYTGTSSGTVHATIISGSSIMTQQITNTGSSINSLALASSSSTPALYTGSQNGQLHRLTWTWSNPTYTSAQVSSYGSAIRSLSVAGSTVYAAAQDGSIYQTTRADASAVTTRPTRHGLPATALAYDSSRSLLYSATSDGKLYQTNWYASTPETISFEAVNGSPSQLVFAPTSSNQQRLYTASSNGGIYQHHWGDAKLGVLQLARP